MPIYVYTYVTTFLVSALFSVVGVQHVPSFSGGTGTLDQLQQWTSTTTPSSAITQAKWAKPLKLTGLESKSCLGTDANGIVGAGTCVGGGSGVWPFTTTAWNGVVAAGTSTNYRNTGTIAASSSFATQASTTLFTNSGNTYLSGITASSLLAVDQTGKVIASTTAGFNVGTALALAVNGANCGAGNAPLGVDTAGAVETCFDVWTEAENTTAAYAPQATTITIAGTANQITSSAGAQSLAANRTWTLSIPTDFRVSSSTLSGSSLFTNATSTTFAISNLTAANCDVKSTTSGSLFCGTDATGSGGGGDPFTHPTLTSSATTSLLLLNGAASSTLFSSYGPAFFGSTATSTFGTDGTLSVATAANPKTNDGAALGTGSLMWSDLFLASGSVLNFNNGDVTLTHASNLLSFNGGDFAINTGSSFRLDNASNNGNSYMFNGGASGLNDYTVTAFGAAAFHLKDNLSYFTGKVAIGTTTPQWGALTVGTSTDPQLMLTDNNPANPLWAFRTVGSMLYIATSTATATSTNAALSINGNSVASLSIGSSTPALSATNGLLTLGTNTANGSTTISTGKFQFNTYDAIGQLRCIVLSSTGAFVSGPAGTPCTQ